MAAASPSSRGSWGTQFGFIMAAVGSAVGLGNMWRFPYQMAENGGAAFLILYVGMVLLIGLPIMLAEFSVGRGSGKSPIDALVAFGGKKWKPLGMLFVAAGFIILGYYGVIAGWVIQYTWTYLVDGVIVDPGATFGAYATGTNAVMAQVLVMLLTIGVVIGGVQSGIERASVFLMPLLFLILIGLAVYAFFLPGSGAGYAYLFKTDFGALFDFGVLRSAAGQALFSLSLGMGAMLTYASYLSKQDDLPKSAFYIGGADTGVAFIAGLMIFPLIFALGLEGALQGDESIGTVGALFITLPETFSSMGPATGRVVGILFFFALFVAAITSAISLLEVVTSTAIDTLKWSRRKATLIMGSAICLIGIPCAIDLKYLTLYDEIAGEVLLVIGALFISLFVGWRMKNPIEEVQQGTTLGRILPGWRTVLRYVVPPILVFILISQVIKAYTEISNAFGG